jgi:hypothetical protein
MPLNIFMESIADAYNDLKRLLDTTESLRKSAGDCDLTDHEGEQRLRVRVIKVYVEAFLEKEITLFRQTAAIYNIIEEITEAESPSKKSPDTE